MNQMKFPLSACLLFLVLVFFTYQPAAAQPIQANGPEANSLAGYNWPLIWLEAKASNHIAYFLFQNPPSIKRFDMAANSWLSDITLLATPTAFTVDSDGIYVAFDLRVARLNLDGSGETTLYTAPKKVIDLFTYNNYLVAVTFDYLNSLDKFSGTFISQGFNPYEVKHYSLGAGKAFGRNNEKIFSVVLNEDGTIGSIKECPYWYSRLYAHKTYVFPDGLRVADDSGYVFNTDDLIYNSQLSTQTDLFYDLAFYANQPVYAKMGTLYALTGTLELLGRFTPFYPPQAIFVEGDFIYSFFGSGTHIDVNRTPASWLNLKPSGTVMDPGTLVFTPDRIMVDKDEVVYLLSRTHHCIVRWSVPQRAYLESILLKETPRSIAYSKETHRLYIAYSTGAVTQIRLGESLQEQPFIQSPGVVYTLATAGQYVFTNEYINYLTLYHNTYNPDGDRLSQVQIHYGMRGTTWSEVNRKMYYLDEYWNLSSEVIDENGILGEIAHSVESYDHDNPVRVAPDGSVVVIGTGHIYDAHLLTRLAKMDGKIQEAAWIASTLYTVQDNRLQIRDANYQVVDSRPLNGSTLALFNVSEGLLMVTSVWGKPYFSVWDPSLNELGKSAGSVVLLPLSVGMGCLDYSEDFSDTTTGWPVGKTSSVTYGYKNGAYRISTLKNGYYLVRAPDCRRESYIVEVDARWADIGSTYGIAFNIVGDFDMFYLFEIDTQDQIYHVAFWDGKTFMYYYENQPAPSVLIGKSTNHLKVTRIGAYTGHNEMEFEINGVVVVKFQLSSWHYPVSVGLVSKAILAHKVSEVFFDNFVVHTLPGPSIPYSLETLQIETVNPTIR